MRPTTAANASPKRRTGAARSCEPPSRDSRERPRSVAFASARTRRLGRTSAPSATMHSSPDEVRVQSETSARTSSPKQEAELQLDRDERRELEQPRVSDDLAEEDIPCGGQRQRAGLGDSRAGTAHVGFVELEGGTQLDDGSRRVPDRREAVTDLVVVVACVNPARVAQHGLENRPDLVRATLEEIGVQALESRLGPAIGGTLRGQRAGEGYRPSRPDVRACLGHACATASSSWFPARMQLSCHVMRSPRIR